MFDGNVGRSKKYIKKLPIICGENAEKVVSPHSLCKIYAESGNNAEISYSKFGRCFEFRP